MFSLPRTFITCATLSLFCTLSAYTSEQKPEAEPKAKAAPKPRLTLEIGQPVPPVTVTKWINSDGMDPSKPDGKHVYVVEFWATWCQPCRQSIPHMNEMWKEYKDKDVVMMGITREGETLVKPFMKKLPMLYSVGLDTTQATSNIWMKNAAGIPQAFIVDRNGVLLWQGHPMNGLDYVLKKAVEGTYTKETAIAVNKAQEKFQAAASRNNLPGIKSSLEELHKLEPDNTAHMAMLVRVGLATSDAEYIKTNTSNWFKTGVETKSSSALLALAAMILDTGEAEMNDPVLAVKATQKALSFEDPSIATLKEAASIFAQVGAPAKSIALLEQALTNADENEKKQMAPLLRYYKALQAIHDAE